MDSNNNNINNDDIDYQILEFLYYESITLTIDFVNNYVINKQDESNKNFNNNKINAKKRIDDINIVIKSYLNSQKITFNEDLLWKGKLCSLVSMTFNLSSHKEVSEKFIYLFLEVSQKYIKNLSQSDFWYELFLIIQVQIIIELNGSIKRPVPMITKAVFSEYQNHEIISLMPIHTLKKYSTKKHEILSELENNDMNEIINKYSYNQFLDKMTYFFKYLLKYFTTPKLILNKPIYI
ncbi:hypothetical protein PIROE2DRAFT_15603 [Piromyces sp. E2]|nr:hypothetical protein PIROE2DRAFT_15603 [Piromyces sp. E2]|eukprot:OUM58990.1 hypothetical protein PIROE2DRAFT_15603 [Piromyces sp. E2]